MLEMLLSAGGMMNFTESRYSRILSGSGTLTPPAGAKAMRVAVIGPGGAAASRTHNTSATSRTVMGGTGGGCAASKIVRASPIAYSIGVPGENATAVNAWVSATPGTDTIASFLDYNLIGPSGLPGEATSTSSLTHTGPTGIGGDYNFKGGNAVRIGGGTLNYATGGGSAGPMGDGANGRAVTSISGASYRSGSLNLSMGWGGAGGGAEGIIVGSPNMVSGGGPGQYTRAKYVVSGNDYKAGGGGLFASGPGAVGGGATTFSGNSNETNFDGPGQGILVVEWFF